MSWLRPATAVLLVTAALALQVSFFPLVAWQGMVPNLCLLVVVGAALARDGGFGMALGFAAGLLLDLAPPADHVAGRWALALVLTAYVAGRVRQDTAPTVPVVLATVAACSFVGTSVFALSGLLLGDLALGVPGLLPVVGASVLWDLMLTPLVLPVVLRLLADPDPEAVAA